VESHWPEVTGLNLLLGIAQPLSAISIVIVLLVNQIHVLRSRDEPGSTCSAKNWPQRDFDGEGRPRGLGRHALRDFVLTPVSHVALDFV